jgi:hypothetical protein
MPSLDHIENSSFNKINSPGVPETMCKPCSNLLISSLKFLPPMQQCIYTFIKSPNASPTFWLYSANSLVGLNIRT